MLMAMAGSVFFYNMETGKTNIGYPVFYAHTRGLGRRYGL